MRSVVMVGDEIVVEGSDIPENKLEGTICKHLRLPAPQPKKNRGHILNCELLIQVSLTTILSMRHFGKIVANTGETQKDPDLVLYAAENCGPPEMMKSSRSSKSLMDSRPCCQVDEGAVREKPKDRKQTGEL